MQILKPRAARRPLARTAMSTVLAATAALGACSDEITAPTPALDVAPRTVQGDAAAPSPEQTKVELTILDKRVTFNPSTGYATVRVSASCSANETFDIVVEMRQDQKDGAQHSTVTGTTTFEDLNCSPGASSFTVAIAPQGGTFVSGNATVTARIANAEPRVIPTEVKRRVRVTA